jgi:hypothetical protein
MIRRHSRRAVPAGQLVANVGPEILIIHARGPHLLFQILHGGDVVLLADLVHSLNYLGIHAYAQVFGALDEQQVVNQIPQKVLFDRHQPLLDLGRRAARAILLDFVLQGDSRALQFAARDDLVVHPRGDLFNDAALPLGGGRRGPQQQAGAPESDSLPDTFPHECSRVAF